MGRIRIMTAAMPRMLSDILQLAIGRHPDLEPVAILTGQEDLRLAVVRLHPDVVLVGGSGRGAESPSPTLARARPTAHIVTLSPSGRHATIQGPGEEPLILEGVSPDQLLRVLTGLVRGRAAAHGEI
jgi:hypothetical protein